MVKYGTNFFTEDIFEKEELASRLNEIGSRDWGCQHMILLKRLGFYYFRVKFIFIFDGIFIQNF